MNSRESFVNSDSLCQRETTFDADPSVDSSEIPEDLKSFFNTLEDFFFVLDIEGRIVHTNVAVQERLGYALSELVGKNVDVVHPPEEKERVAQAVAEMIAGRLAQCSIPMMRKDGTSIPVQTKISRVRWEGQDVFVAVSHDMSERRRVENQLRTKQDEQRDFQEQLKILHEVGNELSTTGSFDDLCQRAVEVGKVRLGFERISLWFLDKVDPDSLVGSFGIDENGTVRDERDQRARVSRDDTLKTFLERQERYIHFPKRPLYNHRQEKIGHGAAVLAGIWDAQNLIGLITTDNFLSRKETTPQDCEVLSLFASSVGHLCSLKRAEEERGALQRLSQRLMGPLSIREIARILAGECRQLFQYDAFAFMLVNQKENRVLLAYNEDTPLGKSEPEEVPSQWSVEVKLAGQPRLLNRMKEPTKTEFKRFGDTERLSRSLLFTPVYWQTDLVGELSVQSYTPGRYNERHLQLLCAFAGQCGGALARLRAEKDKEKLEEQFRQSQKMEAIGQLAGGIAHDFNNLLTGIIGNLSLAEVEELHAVKKYVREANIAATRAEKLIHQLLAFSRKTHVQLKPVNINDIINEVYPLARQTIDRRIDIELSLEDNLPWVEADSTQINSVLMNLCVNARDAINEVMHGGDTDRAPGELLLLQLRTESTEIDENYCAKFTYAKPGRFVVLSVSDNGIGMAEDVRRRIFEPFFTTKKAGQGTGLGLAGAYGIVRQHNGWIQAQSEVGKGTTFRVFLPVATPDTSRPVKESEAESPGGTETVLVVDDEEIIRNLGRTVLQQSGYTVLTAKDGKEALNIWKSKQDRIDLIILDLSMPHLAGHEVLKQLHENSPDLKVIVSSGYSQKNQDELTSHAAVAAYLPKPYRPADLARKVREVLDRSD